ncbi:MAG: APC family permease [Solirubrobacterales bacterium]
MASSTEAQALKSGSIHKWHVLLQSIALMAPAGAIVVTTPIIIGEVGYGTPLIFLIATVACLCIANSVAELTKKFPSAGSFYSANREALGPAAGFITGWLMLVGYALIATGGIAFAAYWAELLFEHWSIDLPFIVPFLAFALLLFVLPYRGIKISIQFDTTVIFFEVGVLLALAVTAISMATGSTEGGDIGSTLSSDAFSNGSQPFFLAFVFGILAFVGFESGAALAEETSNPRKAIPVRSFRGYRRRRDLLRGLAPGGAEDLRCGSHHHLRTATGGVVGKPLGERLVPADRLRRDVRHARLLDRIAQHRGDGDVRNGT